MSPRLRLIVTAAVSAAGGTALWWVVSRRSASDPPRPADELDPRIDRGQAWIRSCLSRLLHAPPSGSRSSYRRERTRPVVKVTRGQRKLIECWAYDDYIRAAAPHPAESTMQCLACCPEVEVRSPNRSGYVTVYVRGPAGASALEWFITESIERGG